MQYFSEQFRRVRGLTNCRELCNCGNECGHYLPIVPSNRDNPLVDANGQVREVTRGCFMINVLRGNANITAEQQPHVRSIRNMYRLFDENNASNNITAMQLLEDNKLNAIESFASSKARSRESSQSYKAAKVALGLTVAARNNRGQRLMDRRNVQEQVVQAIVNRERHRNTAIYNNPLKIYARRLSKRMGEVQRERLGKSSTLIFNFNFNSNLF